MKDFVIDHNAHIPLDKCEFQRIITFYLFECPARTHHDPGSKFAPLERYSKDNYTFSRVSMRGKDFEERGLSGAKLNSLRAAMFRTCDSKKIFYQYFNNNEDISTAIIPDNTDEFIIRKGTGINQTEGIFYSIRNSFAHGDFEIYAMNNEIRLYKFVNQKNRKIKALIQLCERTLLNWIDLVNMSPNQIKFAGK